MEQGKILIAVDREDFAYVIARPKNWEDDILPESILDDNGTLENFPKAPGVYECEITVRMRPDDYTYICDKSTLLVDSAPYLKDVERATEPPKCSGYGWCELHGEHGP